MISKTLDFFNKFFCVRIKKFPTKDNARLVVLLHFAKQMRTMSKSLLNEAILFQNEGNTNVSVVFLRSQLIVEEVAEVLEAMVFACESDNDEDKAELLKELIDLQIVTQGAGIAFGFEQIWDKAEELAYENNMSKLCPITQKPIINPSGRIAKPEGFKKLDLSDLLKSKERNSDE